MLEILLQSEPEKARLGPHDTVVRGAIGRRPGKDVNADLLFIDFASFTLEGAQADELEEPREPGGLGEGAGG